MKNAEPKFREITSSGVREDIAFGSAKTLNMTSIDQGVTQNTRIGNMIQITGIHFHCGFGQGLTNDVTDPRYARVIVYTARDSDVTDLNVTPFTYPDKEQFIIWADKTVPVPSATQISNSMITIRKKFRPYMKCLFDANVLNIVEKNPVKVMITTNAVAGNEASVVYQCRLYYRDL